MPDSLREYNRKRDFAKTAEPSGGAPKKRRKKELRFVIQKHAASHLHYDLRLEMEGVMRSWAVPKGPSLDPRVRRLAMEVEDHPIAYNDFEGTIPKGEYGGGTVMLWDVGSYFPDEMEKGETPEKAMQRGYRDGKLSITFEGERLHGSFALVRTDAVPGGQRSKWLLLKHKDAEADTGLDITEREDTSVTTGRTMDEITAGMGEKRVWHSNRKGKAGAGSRSSSAAKGGKVDKAVDLKSLLPMLSKSGSVPPSDPSWIFEPKYDGIRVLALVTPGKVALVTRNGLDKARQFPEIVTALKGLVKEAGQPFVLDGEVVALEDGRVVRFESLQGRMHLQDPSAARRHGEDEPAAIVAFDILLLGGDVLLNEAWTERRARLEELLEDRLSPRLMISEVHRDRTSLQERAEKEGWEGLMAKRTTAVYRPGQRTSDWIKLKIENRQEFVVGGWTEPRKTRPYFGALLLGYYDSEGKLQYSGHTGTGFDGKSLADMYRRLKAIERKSSPFAEKPPTNEPAHWVDPTLVVEVKFNEWTKVGMLRHPVFVGLRDDKEPKDVVREPAASGIGSSKAGDGSEGAPAARGKAAKKLAAAKPAAERSAGGKAAKEVTPKKLAAGKPATGKAAKKITKDKPAAPTATRASRKSTTPPPALDALDTPVVRRIREIAARNGEGALKVGAEGTIPVTSLQKVFFPETGHTKQDLLIYYSRMTSYILPSMEDRPLVLKRFPNGVEGEAFYQQAAPDSPPAGVRVETLRIEGKKQRRIVGGNLATLLYTIQLGAVSFDPWHSRIGDLDSADYTVLDLDPGPGVDFQGVVEIARYVKEELDELGMHAAIKTSGSSGIHIYVPLPDGTPLDAATLVAQIIATRVVQKHPTVATIERMTKNRPHGTVYVDYLQNILGKTVAGVYAVRAKKRPTVSTPLAWEELTDELDLQAFTVDTVPARVEEVGDLWKGPMSKPNSLEAFLKKKTTRKG